MTACTHLLKLKCLRGMNMKTIKTIYFLLLNVIILLTGINRSDAAVARDWNELLLDAIRADQARPTVHARNLFHVSAAMYDAWCIYDTTCTGVFYTDKHSSNMLEDDRDEVISYACLLYTSPSPRD